MNKVYEIVKRMKRLGVDGFNGYRIFWHHGIENTAEEIYEALMQLVEEGVLNPPDWIAFCQNTPWCGRTWKLREKPFDGEVLTCPHCGATFKARPFEGSISPIPLNPKVVPSWTFKIPEV